MRSDFYSIARFSALEAFVAFAMLAALSLPAVAEMPATDALASESSFPAAVGRVVAALLTVPSWPFVGALYLADSAGNVVGHRSEFQADRRVVRMGYGRNLSSALRRVIATGGSHRAVGWRQRIAATHPPARTRVARIDAMLRHPAA